MVVVAVGSWCQAGRVLPGTGALRDMPQIFVCLTPLRVGLVMVGGGHHTVAHTGPPTQQQWPMCMRGLGFRKGGVRVPL
jgi:hypothetical protein